MIWHWPTDYIQIDIMQNINKKYAILFVDDEEKALKYFSRLFSDEFVILTAPNTELAKAILQEKHQEIGILITDQRMPEETGVKLLQHTKENYPNIIRLLTTAYSDLRDAIEAVNTGEILRYITKPWDIDLLRLELRHALRFFLLKNERDLLLREKLNAWLRLVGINKARDLIIFAYSFDKLSNSRNAVMDFLRQIPVNQSSQSYDIERLDEWSLSKSQILDTLNLITQVTQVFSSVDNYIMEKVPVAPFLKTSSEKYGAEFVSSGTLPDMTLNTQLFELLIQQLVSQIKALAPGEPVKLDAQATGSGMSLTLSSSNDGWTELSILDIPVELLASYLICYHHDGVFTVQNGDDNSTRFRLDFTSTKVDVEKETDLEEDLDEILSRFEFWT